VLLIITILHRHCHTWFYLLCLRNVWQVLYLRRRLLLHLWCLLLNLLRLRWCLFKGRCGGGAEIQAEI